MNEPVFGAIAIMKFSHVTFIVGFTNDKKEIYALGGNQSSKVKIERYDRKKVMEYRFPISGGYSQLKQVAPPQSYSVTRNTD